MAPDTLRNKEDKIKLESSSDLKEYSVINMTSLDEDHLIESSEEKLSHLCSEETTKTNSAEIPILEFSLIAHVCLVRNNTFLAQEVLGRTRKTF